VATQVRDRETDVRSDRQTDKKTKANDQSMLFPYDALQGLKSKVITSKITIQQAKRSCKSTQSEISKCLLSLLIAGEQVGYQRRAPARAAQRVSNSLD